MTSERARTSVLRSVLMLVLASSSTQSQSAGVVHPDAASLVSPPGTILLSKRDTLARSAELGRLGSSLRRAARVDSLGSLDGPVDESFGMIMDLTVDSSGAVYVLDMANLQVLVFRQGSRIPVVIGRQGSGPLEFRGPVSLWTEANGEVAVVDAALGAKFFRVQRSGQAQLTRSIRMLGSPMSACGFGGSVFAIEPSVQDGSTQRSEYRLVRVYSQATGEVTRSFGETYEADTPLIRTIMSEGAIGCSGDGTIILALSKLPFVVGFSARGERLWTVRLRDFTVGRSIERLNARGQQSIGLDPTDPRNSFIRRITPISGGYAVVQVGFMTSASLRNGTIWERVDSYLLRTSSGEGVYIGDKLPLLGGVHGNRAFGFENDPFPRVIEFRLRDVGQTGVRNVDRP